MLHTCSGSAIFLVHLHSHFALHASAPEFQAKAVGHRSEQGMMTRERSNAALHAGQVRLSAERAQLAGSQRSMDESPPDSSPLDNSPTKEQ